jgi:hypothetical protein
LMFLKAPNKCPIVAVHESLHGTFRTYSTALTTSVRRGKADIAIALNRGASRQRAVMDCGPQRRPARARSHLIFFSARSAPAQRAPGPTWPAPKWEPSLGRGLWAQPEPQKYLAPKSVDMTCPMVALVSDAAHRAADNPLRVSGSQENRVKVRAPRLRNWSCRTDRPCEMRIAVPVRQTTEPELLLPL